MKTVARKKGSGIVLDVRKIARFSTNNDILYNVDVGAIVAVVLLLYPTSMLLVLALIVAAALYFHVCLSCNHLLPQADDCALGTCLL